MFLGCTQFLSILVEQRQIVSPVKDALPLQLINNPRCGTDQYLHIVNGELYSVSDCRVPLWANQIRSLLVFSVLPLDSPLMSVIAMIVPKDSHQILDMVRQPTDAFHILYFRSAFLEGEASPWLGIIRPVVALLGSGIRRVWRPLMVAKRTLFMSTRPSLVRRAESAVRRMYRKTLRKVPQLEARCKVRRIFTTDDDMDVELGAV